MSSENKTCGYNNVWLSSLSKFSSVGHFQFLQCTTFALSCFCLLLILSPWPSTGTISYDAPSICLFPTQPSVSQFRCQFLRKPRSCAPAVCLCLLACLYPPLACGCPESIFFSFVSPEPAQCRTGTKIFISSIYIKV